MLAKPCTLAPAHAPLRVHRVYFSSSIETKGDILACFLDSHLTRSRAQMKILDDWVIYYRKRYPVLGTLEQEADDKGTLEQTANDKGTLEQAANDKGEAPADT